MNNDLVEKVITVSGIEMKQGPYGNIAKIKDEQNLTYSVFEKKKDNTISAAWKNLPKIGETVMLAFAEEHKEYEGKPYTQRKVRIINADIGNGMKNHQAQTARRGAPAASEPIKDDKFWDMKAYSVSGTTGSTLRRVRI